MQNCVLEYLENTVINHADKIAVIDGDRKITFGRLQECAQRLATTLIKRDTKSHCPVAVYLPKGSDCLVGFLGTLYSGNFYVPIDTKSPIPRVTAILGNLQPLFVITSAQYLKTLQSIGVKNNSIILIEAAHEQSGEIEYDQIVRRVDQTVDTDPVYIIYTSGSTGLPKGVVIPHRGVIDYIDWAAECFSIGLGEIIGSQSPFTFDNSTLDIFLTLATGATLVIIPEQMFAFPATLMAYINEMKISFIFWVPSILVNVAKLQVLDQVKVGSLKKVLFAGEVMPSKHLNYWRKSIPGALYANLYGPTEITVDCTYYIVDRYFEDTESIPIGTACRNSDIIILDKANQRVVEPNRLGELCVRGSSLALGYWNDPNKTNSAFVQNPLQTYYPERIYRTGDLVYLNERDEIIYSGRMDSQIKHMGYRIELGEIENAVLSLSEIGKACVLYNNEIKEIALFFEAQKKTTPGIIRQKLGQLLPKYMIPTRYYNVDEIPLNDNGKIDRPRLSKEYG